jgi:soluble lytic murein transglycosylase-like protein
MAKQQAAIAVQRFIVQRFNVDDVFDPKQNIDAGATYLRQLLDKYQDDIKLSLAAYNAGPNSVDQTGGIPDIKETRDKQIQPQMNADERG